MRRLDPLNPRLAWGALAGAMVLAGLLILWAGRGTSFQSDELDYFARHVERSGKLLDYGFGLELLVAPHNDHLQFFGRLIYEGLFATAGTDYAWYRLVAVAGYLLCVGLFFALARRRVGDSVALAFSVLLLFCGAGWEVMLWPFDLHTLFALAAGLGALLVLERGGRRADLLACVLLVVAVATIEVGVGFVVAVAISVAQRPDRWQRAWIVVLPLVLYGVWTIWAQQFHQNETELSNLAHLATSVPSSLAATVGALTGLINTGADQFPVVLGSIGFEIPLAIGLALAFAWRVASGPVPPTFWPLVGALAVYWAGIAVAARPPDGSRYVLVSAVLVLLIAGDAVRGWRPTRPVLALIVALVVLAIPTNVIKLFDGRDHQLGDAQASRSEYAMLELAAPVVAEDYAPSGDPRVQELAPVPFYGLEAGDYLRAADRVGAIGYSLEELREQKPEIRLGADASLVGALEIGLDPATAPADRTTCETLAPGAVEVLEGGPRVYVRALEPGAVVAVGRFGDGPGVPVGTLDARDWAVLELPMDAAPDSWSLGVDRPALVCPEIE